MDVQVVIRIIERNLDTLQHVLQELREFRQPVRVGIRANIREVTLVILRTNHHLIGRLGQERTPSHKIFTLCDDRVRHPNHPLDLLAIDALVIFLVISVRPVKLSHDSRRHHRYADNLAMRMRLTGSTERPIVLEDANIFDVSITGDHVRRIPPHLDDIPEMQRFVVRRVDDMRCRFHHDVVESKAFGKYVGTDLMFFKHDTGEQPGPLPASC